MHVHNRGCRGFCRCCQHGFLWKRIRQAAVRCQVTDVSVALGWQVPKVGSHLAEQGVHPTMYCSHWFITIFAYTLPFDHLLRVWDIFLFEGIKVVFRCVASLRSH